VFVSSCVHPSKCSASQEHRSLSIYIYIYIYTHTYMDRDSSVGIATRYGMDVPEIESRCGRDFPYLSRTALGLTQPPIQLVPVIFPGGKAAEAWLWPPTTSSAEVKERVGLYLYSPSGPSWPVTGWNLPLYRVSKEESARLRENVPYVKVYRYNPKHLYPKLNGYGDNDQRKVWSSCGSTYCTC
jgi:hypothetical protein